MAFISGTILAAAPVPFSGKISVNGVNFDGTAQFTFALRDANVSAEHIFAVAMMKQGASQLAPILSTGDAPMIRRNQNLAKLAKLNNVDFQYPNGTSQVDGVDTLAYAYDEFHVSVTSKGSGTTGVFSNVVFGRDSRNLSDLRHWKGEIVEILVYERSLNTGEIEQIQQYLGHKWGVTIDSQ